MACLFPVFPHGQPVPCGKCPQCLVRRTNSWVFRIMQEEKHCKSISWIRLSYDNANLPLSDNGLPTLSKRHLQLFFKRLRYYTPRDAAHPIKYFLCGEYGTQRGRPHYHVLILNANIELFNKCWVNDIGHPRGEVWIDTRPITEGCIGYTLGYMFKKKVANIHRFDDRQPEFHLMSKGLGKCYLTDTIIEYHRADVTRCFVTLPGGSRSALPRYYADKIYNYSSLDTFLSAKEMQAEILDKTVREQHLIQYEEHVRMFGSGDNFARTQWNNRIAAIENFQARAKLRK